MASTTHTGVSEAGSTSLPQPSARGPASAALTTLFERAAAGDSAAFAELYDATAARVYGLALRIVRDPAQAEEVAQESYLKLWRMPLRFDPRRGSAISWLLMITRAAAIDRVRSAQATVNRDETHHRQSQALFPARPDPTYDLAHASFEAKRVRAALAELSAIQRQALELAYFCGYTHPEIAARLGLPVSTAKTRIRDGLIRLRELVGES